VKRQRPEAAFQRQVIELAHLRGWRVAHFRPGMNERGQWQTAVQADGAGFPDLFLVRAMDGKRLVAELKVPPNKVTPEQERWLNDCEACGIPAFTWTPDDWDEIDIVLEKGP
jgi:VRR-NUC domain